MNERIGIIGLGRCGLPAAEKFVGGGYQVFGYARRPEVIEKFKNLGGIHLENPAKVAAAVETVIVIVLNDDQVKEVVAGKDGILAGASPGATVICMSTINRANLVWVSDQCLQKEMLHKK